VHCTFNRSESKAQEGENKMEHSLTALLVHDQEEPFRTLEQSLLSQGVRIQHANTCAEARAALRGPRSPRLVLTDAALADGTWADVLNLASWGAVPVIVVSRLVDMDLYLRTLENGASDFIVPPLSPAELAHVVKTAIGRSFGSLQQRLASLD
jgi:DNA-binding response OmpR family regulator